MSDHTIVNLGDVENVAPKFGMPDGMDVRFPRRALGCTTGGIGVEKLGPGTRVPFGHKHDAQEEIYVIAEGYANYYMPGGAISPLQGNFCQVVELKPDAATAQHDIVLEPVK